MLKISLKMKEEAVRKYLSGISAQTVCQEIGVSNNTIYNWTKKYGILTDSTYRVSVNNTTSEKVKLLTEYQSLGDDKRGEWLRTNGLKTGHLELWMKELDSESRKKKALKDENRKLKEELKMAQREIRRKDKALAESAALLVLKKKYQHLWEDEE